MPYLRKDAAACSVYGFSHRLPGIGLLLRPDARDIRVADALRHNRNALGDDQAGSGALCVVFDHKRRRKVVSRAAQASQGTHDHTIRQCDFANLNRI
jgi:hypothetical protein